MALFRMLGRNGVTGRMVVSGDLVAGGESLLAGSLATVGAGTWLGSAIATGIIYRTGSTAAYTDTTDTAINILNALAGNALDANADLMGTTFRLLVINSVAFVNTFAAGAGVIAGGGVLNIAASTWREYLVTILNPNIPETLNATFLSGSPTVNFVLPPGLGAFPIGPSPLATNLTNGMSAVGTGIPAGTTVAGVTMGQGGVIGVTLSANTTAASASQGNSVAFGPSVKFDGLRSGSL